MSLSHGVEIECLGSLLSSSDGALISSFLSPWEVERQIWTASLASDADSSLLLPQEAGPLARVSRSAA